MDERIESLCGFLDSAKSVYHGIDSLRWRLEGEEYQYLPESGVSLPGFIPTI